MPANAYAPGKKERESEEYKKENPDPKQREYYEKGGRSTNHDSACRARVAHRAARYGGPAKGYEKEKTQAKVPANVPAGEAPPPHADGPRPKAGGEKTASQMPQDPETIAMNVYKFVEDVTYPKNQPNPFKPDSDICAAIEAKQVDIGKPWAGKQFMCIETAAFFASLMRELGFPAREKNVLPSFADNTYDTQTAATNVWYGGKWHFFDPWESFTDTKDYLTKDGHAGFVNANSYHDVDVWARVAAPEVTGKASDFFFGKDGEPANAKGWKKLLRHEENGAEIKTRTFALQFQVKDAGGEYAGFDAPRPELDEAIYVSHDAPVQRSHSTRPLRRRFGEELLTLLYPDRARRGTRRYSLLVENPTRRPARLDARLDEMEATVAMEVSPARIRTSLDPGERRRFPFSVRIGRRLRLPPDPVEDARVDPDGVLRWSAVRGARAYEVFAGGAAFGRVPAPGVRLLGRTSATSFPAGGLGGEIVGVRAVGARGRAGRLDPEGGSTAYVRTAAPGGTGQLPPPFDPAPGPVFTPPPGPDLVVDSIDSAEAKASGCEVSYTVRNRGTAEAGPAITQVDGHSDELEDADSTDSDELAPGESEQKSVVLSLPCSPLTVTVSADSSEILQELSETNNSRERAFP